MQPIDDSKSDAELLLWQQLTAQRADQLCRERICRAREHDVAVWLEAEREILSRLGVDLSGSVTT